jgi:hypothetical protein
MKSDKEIAREALKRAAVIREARARKKRRVYAVCCTAACLAVIVGLSFALPMINTDAAIPDGIYSATLFAGSAAGGFVIIGIIGFVLGVAVTLFFVRKQKKD